MFRIDRSTGVFGGDECVVVNQISDGDIGGVPNLDQWVTQ